MRLCVIARKASRHGNCARKAWSMVPHTGYGKRDILLFSKTRSSPFSFLAHGMDTECAVDHSSNPAVETAGYHRASLRDEAVSRHCPFAAGYHRASLRDKAVSRRCPFAAAVEAP